MSTIYFWVVIFLLHKIFCFTPTFIQFLGQPNKMFVIQLLMIEYKLDNTLLGPYYRLIIGLKN